MRKKYLPPAAGLLVLAALLAPPATGQILPNKGKVSASLLSLAAQPTTNARGTVPQSRAAAGSSPFKTADRIQVYDGYVVIEAVATTADAQQLLADLTARGLRRGTAYGAMVSGLFPVSQLAALEGVASLRHVRPAYKPVMNVGLTTSQGDRALRADVARARYRVSGKGVNVGILSDSYNNLGTANAGVASNDLPANVQVLEDLPSGGSDEGRGMAEIVHDVAPDAGIAFHTAFLGQANFAQGIIDLQAAGNRVIVDDIIYFAEPFFQNGIIAQAAETVVRRGSSYFSSAGNSGEKSYEARFRNSGTTLPGIEGEAHSFADGDVTQSITIAPGRGVSLALQWDDPFFSASGVRGAETDLDLYVLFGGEPIFASADNNLGGDPFEFLGLTNNGTTPATIELVIVKVAGPDPTRIKYVNFGDAPAALEYDTRSSTLVGHANAPLVTAVAAAPYFQTPVFNPATPVPVVEAFSSLGGTPLLFDNNGNRRRPLVLPKPEITGPDGTNTSFFPDFPGADFDRDGFPNFFGTSASAPHVAAVAALMQEASTGLLPPLAIRGLLQVTAQDMDNPLTPNFDRGFDFKTGTGFVRADAALRLLAPIRPVQDALALLFSLFPNPSNGQVTFQITAPDQQDIKLSVVDGMGKEVFHEEGKSVLKLTHDFSNLPKGLYVAKVQTNTEVKSQILQIQ
ncbi:T9SS type A sorting domain-containing protein [Hymenobacter sp.]|uniref:T9SS type A sorting domain-containing protein n=1 Tax=Hymenobacter sp. TaxID=1898978 RepID=UPI00286A4075|nr:T9SS type A sorting domain-containing protein [Hymenobacter sp.]